MTKQILLSLLNCSWQWGLLGGLTWLITRRFRHTNSTSHVLWLLFLLSLPILFILNQFVPAISINTTVPELTQTQVQSVHISSLAAQDVLIPETVAVPTEIYTQSQGHTVTKSQFSFNWTMTDVVLCIWAIGTLAMLVRVAFGLYRIRRLRRRATVADSAYQAVCKRFAQQLNINRPVSVYLSDQIVSPISFGWLSPSILIPRTLNLEQFELVAAHELAHVQRLDWLTNLFSHVVGAIFFFHPICHFLNRKLVHLRERICDDWVIQLTGARKNYAQCLLDMVHHKEQPIPLALGLNEPSELESRINAILKNNRQLDLQPRRRLLVVAVTLLLTCLPLLAMAQLVPLKTVQFSLFAQTPQESEKVEKKRGEQKKTMKMKDKKEYKEDKSIKVLDPAGFNTSEDRVFSGPQPGEKLPPLKVTGITGKFDGKEFDIVKASDGKPLLLFMQDDSVVGLKGLYLFANTIAPIMDKVDEQLHTAVVFLRDNLTETSKLVDELDKFSKSFQLGVSRDGREGPGVYGLNRNVAQTIIIAKEGKVLHNFAFTQPMLSPDPYVLGALGEAIGVKPAILQGWLNPKIPTLEIKNPAEGEETGKMLLKGTFVIDGNVVHLDGTVVKFHELLTFLRNLPEEQKSTFIIQTERDVLHEQITKVMDIAKEAGIEKIGFGISENVKIPTLEIKNPAEGEDTGKMLLKGLFILDGNVVHLDGTVVKFDELLTFLRNLPEEQKSLLSIQSEENVPHEQIVKILNITKKAGIKEFFFPRIEEILNMEKDKEGDPSPEERIRRDGDPKASPEGRRMKREGERERERTPSAEELVKQFDKDGDGNQENVTIPDANLAAVVREALGLAPNAPIPKKKLEALEILYAVHKDIGDLTGLEKATGLKILTIRGDHSQKKIRDITPLAGLTQLTKLSLSENRIKDIKPLAGLTQLKDLKLNNNELIHDITPLSGLKHLIHLSLYNNQIRDITPIADLKQLISLRIFMNEISDITPIANLKQLIHLDISINEISDITPIANLEQLTDLRLQSNRIHDITPIANLKQLTDLELNSNRIHDITPLSGLRQLTDLWISNNQIRDITPLTELTQLTSIRLSNNPIKIRDMDPIRMLLKQQPDLEIDITIPPDEEGSRYRKDHIEVKNPDEFKKGQEKVFFSGPQPGQKLPPLKATAINGEAKGETFDFIAKADGQPLVLFLQDETPLGLRGLVGVSRLFGQIAEKSKQTMQMHAVFLLKNQASKTSKMGYYQRELVPFIPSNILLGISQDGREGPGSYGLNRSVAQTVIIAKDGKVLHYFAFTQPMPWPDPHVLGAIGEAIGVQPTKLENWLNETYPVIPTWWTVKNPVIQIKNPAEGEETGKMLLNGTFVRDGKNREIGHLRGTVVQFDELRTLLRNYPDEHKSTLMLIIQAGRDVPHEQVVKVMDIAKEAGMEKIGFAIDSAEDKSMESGSDDAK